MNLIISVIILTTVVLATKIVMTSSHWLLGWIGFEMNVLAIIHIMMKNFNLWAMEASTKYFLMKAITSMLLMMAVTINLLYSSQ